MRVSAPLIVAVWVFLLLLLAALLAGMGGYYNQVAVYYGAIIVFALFAVAVAVSQRHNRLRAGPWRATPGGGTMLLLAVALLTGGLGLAFRWWMSACSVPLFVAAAVHEAYTRRKRLKAD
jgi:NADH:ubiquinone oxidoreductase subunit 6 (subunit J)